MHRSLILILSATALSAQDLPQIPDLPDIQIHLPDIMAQVRVNVERAQQDAQRAQQDAQKAVERAQIQIGKVGADASYQAGQRALDRRDYEQAVERFDSVITAKATRADGALYWKAYALYKLGRKDQALAALGDLEKQFPQSRWLPDARALTTEARSNNATPENQGDEELKLLALNSLIRQEPDRAIPLLEKILSDSKSAPSLKRQALFVLARSKTPRAHEILAQYAKGASNPDLQSRAIEYLGSSCSAEDSQTLTSLYTSSSDAGSKREVIHALARCEAAKQLVEIVRKESDQDMKRQIVRELSQMKSKEALDYLLELLSK